MELLFILILIGFIVNAPSPGNTDPTKVIIPQRDAINKMNGNPNGSGMRKINFGYIRTAPCLYPAGRGRRILKFQNRK